MRISVVPLPRARARRRRAESASGRGAARAAKRARRGGGLPQDLYGNLLSVELPDGRTIEYDVDGAGRRVGRRVLDAQEVELEYRGWIYRDLLRPIAEVDGSGNVVARYVYLDGEGSRQNGMHQLATRLGANQDTSLPFAGSNVPEYIELLDGSGVVTQRLRLVVNQVGTVQAVVDVATGEVVQRLEHDEFGRVLFDSNPGLQPFGFAGGLVDADTGLVRFGARDYEPVTGRWTARDPVRFEGGQNVFGYATGDGINALDPSGFDGVHGGECQVVRAVSEFGSCAMASFYCAQAGAPGGPFVSGGAGFGCGLICAGAWLWANMGSPCPDDDDQDHDGVPDDFQQGDGGGVCGINMCCG